MKTIIHINKHHITHNNKHDDKKPVITVKTYKSNNYCNQVAILDDTGKEVAKVVYSPDKPLSCGAVVWIETQNEIKIIS